MTNEQGSRLSACIAIAAITIGAMYISSIRTNRGRRSRATEPERTEAHGRRTAQRARRPNWFAIWMAALAAITITSAVISAAMGVTAISNRVEPLPVVERPTVEHEGIYPTATHELEQQIRVSTAALHRETLLQTVMAGIEQSGGRVKRQTSRKIEAVAPKGYVTSLNEIRDAPDGSEYRNPRYEEWARRAATTEQGRPRAAGSERTAFTIGIDPTYMPNRLSAHLITGALIATLIGTITIMICYGAREDIERQNNRGRSG